MWVFVFFIIVTVPVMVGGQDCECTRTGISNGIQTDSPGCQLTDTSPTQPVCYVESSESCPEALPSDEIEGAAFINCPVDDAIFYAAETDDVESIIRFRELGENLTVTDSFPVRGGTEWEFSLLSFAAAHGSFGVAEDLLINEDYICGEGLNVTEALCLFSDEGGCQEDATERTAMISLIDFTYEQVCESREVSVRPTSSESTSAPSTRPGRRGPEGAVPLEATRTVPVRCGEHPYIVSLRSSFNGGYNHRCGGVLVAPDAVLTAAHCVDGSQGGTFDPILVIEAYSREGTGICPQDSEIRKARAVVLHPEWSRGRYAQSVGNGKDVALIQLNEPSSKTPISISSETTLDIGESLRFLGMGRATVSGPFVQELQIVEIEAADPAICNQAYPGGVASNVLCVGGDEADFCIGDDGGPLYRVTPSGDELVGIAHLKHPDRECGTRGTPGLYANAARLRRWINSTRNSQF